MTVFLLQTIYQDSFNLILLSTLKEENIELSKQTPKKSPYKRRQSLGPTKNSYADLWTNNSVDVVPNEGDHDVQGHVLDSYAVGHHQERKGRRFSLATQRSFKKLFKLESRYKEILKTSWT